VGAFVTGIKTFRRILTFVILSRINATFDVKLIVCPNKNYD